MKSVEVACILGVTIRSIQDNGKIIRCMERVIFGGLMAKSILEILVRIRGMDMESLDGEMDVNMKENGLKESSMEQEFIEM